MRLSTWITLPFYVLPISSLALPATSGDVPDVAIAGSIATNNTISVTSELETEYQKLEILKAQLHDLHHQVSRQEHTILKLINRDFNTCGGVGCYIQTAVRKAPDFFELLKTHFRHHPLTTCPNAGPCSPKEESSQPPSTGVFNFVQDLPSPAEPLKFHEPPSPKPFEFHNPPPAEPFEFHSPPSAEPFTFDERPERPHHPPFPPVRPGDFHRPDKDHRLPFEPPQEWRPPHGHPSDHEPWKDGKEDHPQEPHHRPHRPHHMLHPAPRHRHYRLILATVGLIVAFLIFAILFKALRVYCANPRVRANRAARIEECRTRREYKRAACQHRFRKMVTRLIRRPQRRDNTEEEEKEEYFQQGSPYQERTSVNDHIVGTNIESLRRAHEIVGQLMRAEEGRTNGVRAFSPASLSDSTAPSVVSTLPPYALPPPRYSQELSRDMEVVDGFRYTPSNSEASPSSLQSSFVFDDDDLTESSVVDCRSRMSMETDGLPLSRKSLELAGDRYRGQFN